MYAPAVFLMLAGLAVAGQQLPPVEIMQAQDVPLLVSLDSVDAEHGVALLRVTNQSPQTITAWSFESTSYKADGHVSVFRVAQDFYPGMIFSGMMAGRQDGPVAAGETRVVKFPMSRSSAVPVTRLKIRPSFVILDDQTASGNPDRIQELFAKRQLDLAAVKDVANVSQRATASMVSLNQLDDDLTSPLSAEQRNTIGEQARRDVRNLINASRKGTVTPDRSAVAIKQLMDRYVSAVERYATPKQ